MRFRFRALLSAVLILGLLLVQQGALHHGLSHLLHAPAPDQIQLDDEDLAHEAVCDVCLAYAALAAAPDAARGVGPQPCDETPPPAPRADAPLSAAAAYAARAPPIAS